jgi:hypothetical protein
MGHRLPAGGYRRQLVRVGKPSFAEKIGQSMGMGAAAMPTAVLAAAVGGGGGGGGGGSPLAMLAREAGLSAGGGAGSTALVAAAEELEALAAHATQGGGRPLAILPSALGL